jgi:hypothetical protein
MRQTKLSNNKISNKISNKNNNKMRTTILFLATVLCLCTANKTMAQTVASGRTGACTWELTGTSPDYTLAISGNGAMGNYSSSSVPWYSYRSNIKTLDIQQGVTTIGEYAFYGCSGLTSVAIPNSVTSIGIYAFSSCSGLTGTLTIPNSVTSIGSSAFSGCSGLTGTLTIPNSVTSIGSSTFRDCIGLTSISVDAGNTAYSSNSGVLFNKDQTILICYPVGKTGSYTIPNTVTSIGEFAFYSCSDLTGTLTIPNSVTSIGASAFYSCIGLTSISISNSVTSIGASAFSGCSSLTGTLTIPNSVTSIGASAFSGCSGLITLNFNATNCTSMGIPLIGPVFSGCSSLSTLIIGSNVQNIPSYAFSGCNSLTSIINLNPVPQTVSSNGGYYYTMNIGVDKNACTLTVATSALTAYQNATVWKDFTSITGGGILLSAKTKYPNIGSVSSTLPNGLYPVNTAVTLTASSADYTFFGWTSGANSLENANPFNFTLTQDTLITAVFGKPANFNLATAGTLKNQTDIKTFTHLTLTGNIDARDVQFMRDSMPILLELDLSGATIVAYSGKEGTVYGTNTSYPANGMPQYSFYQSTTGTAKTALTLVQLPTSITSIGQYAFYGCSGLTSITIPNLVTSIGNSAFNSCSGLTSVSFNAINCTSMDNSNPVFYGCSSFSTLTIGNNVQNIPDYAFYRCSGLTSVTIGNSVTTIGQYAFYYCSGLTSVTIPDSVTSIGNSAFYNCSGLTSVTIGNSVTSIGYSTFYNCSGLTSVIISNSVTTISDYAFHSCSALASITIPNSVTSIGGYAFYDCSSLTTVDFNATNCMSMENSSYPVFSGCFSLSTLTIGSNVQNIPDYAFSGCSGLTSVTNLNPVPQTINSNVFDGVTKSACTLTVSTSSVNAYQNAAVWEDFAPITGGGILLSAKTKYPNIGSVSSTLPDGLYPANTAVMLTASSADYSFLGWTSGANSLGNANPFTFTLTQDTLITAEFGHPANFNLATAGTLKNQTGIKTFTHLTLTGNIDARDIQFMRLCEKPKSRIKFFPKNYSEKR